MRSLLVAVCESEACRTMFEWVADNELRPDDKLHLLHVSMKDTPGGGALPSSDYFEQAHPQTAQKVVVDMLHEQFVAPLRAAFPDLEVIIHNVQAAQDSKTVGHIICEKARQLKPDHVFIGGSSHHCSKMSQLLAGSVVKYCKEHCSAPLTVVQGAGKGQADVLQTPGGAGVHQAAASSAR